MRRWKALPRDAVVARFALLMRLRQLSVHPQVYINARRNSPGGYERNDWDMPSMKFTVLKDMITKSNGDMKWIVFCQFHNEMDLLQTFLEKVPGIARIQQYHGGISDAEKEQVIKNTHTEVQGHDILLLQLHSGGVGLNLQHFTRIVFMSPWWTSALMDQAIGRAVRIGQKAEVKVYMLLLQEEMSLNIDEAMMVKADAKRDMLLNIFKHASRGTTDPNVEDVDEEDFDENEMENEVSDVEDEEEE